MKKTLLFLLCALSKLAATASEPDGRIQRECLWSLAHFMQYASNLYTDAGINARGDSIGYFKANDAGRSNEDGVRTNADLSMVAAFVYEMGRVDNIALPQGLTYPQLRRMAIRSFRYACATHRANQLAVCTDKKHWGSDPEHHQWESSLWALSVAVAAEFIDRGWGLTTYDTQQLERLLAAEADYQLTRPVPTGFKGDTKAEENGWESNVLAAACAFFPEHPNAKQWYEALLRYGFNCYTIAADGSDSTRVAGRKAKEWFAGANLYDDFTLQNHNYFHTSYQNVVMQEMAESLIAFRLAENTKKPQAVREALTWHWNDVWERVLAQLALCDGELAMPNGNDWSMFLYDQLPAYAAMATIGRHPDALMLEERCLQSLLSRQKTTPDGSYMLHPDIGPRRMGVTAHRVLMTYLLHEMFPTNGLRPSTWESFQRRHAWTRTFPNQHLVRSMSKDRFTCFSWSEGLKNCTGIIVPNTVSASKIFVPYKNGFGGNITGKPEKMMDRPVFITDSTEWVAYVQGKHPYCIWSTAGNAVIVINDPKTKDAGLMAVSMDPLTQERRTLYTHNMRQLTADGRKALSFSSQWVNIDKAVAVVLPERSHFQFSERKLINSVWTSTLTPKNDVCVYFSNVDETITSSLADATQQWNEKGWKVVFTMDPDGTAYLLAFNPGTGKKSFKVPRKLKKLKNLRVKIVGGQ